MSGKEVYVGWEGACKHFNISQILPDPAATSDKELERLKQSFDQFRSSPPAGIMITEIVTRSDPRAKTEEMRVEIENEMRGLAERGTFKIISREDLEKIGKTPNVMGGRFVLAIKNVGTGKEVCKARYVVQGHTDLDKSLLVHNTTTLQKSSIRMLIALAAISGFRLWTQDISQAYLQSARSLMRDFYIKPSKEWNLESDQLLKLLKPLYGLSESGDYWHETFFRHLREDLQTRPSTGDLSCFFKTVQGKLASLIGTYVDDTLCAGDGDFEESSRLTEKIFESKKR